MLTITINLICIMGKSASLSPSLFGKVLRFVSNTIKASACLSGWFCSCLGCLKIILFEPYRKWRSRPAPLVSADLFSRPPSNTVKKERGFNYSRCFVSKINSTIKLSRTCFRMCVDLKIYSFYSLNSLEIINLHVMRDFFNGLKLNDQLFS